MSVIALVPSRSGSKGVKHKNLRAIGGRSLLYWAARAVQQSQMIARGYISTDSLLHEKLGIKYGLSSFGLRSPLISGDDSKTADVLIDFLKQLGLPDDDNYLVLLQPTSPLRDGALIDQCIEMALRTKEPVVTVAPIIEPHPYKTLIEKDGLIQPLRNLADLTTPRQKLPKAFLLTGAVYVLPFSVIRAGSIITDKTSYVIQEDFVNIDSFTDLQAARRLLFFQKA